MALSCRKTAALCGMLVLVASAVLAQDIPLRNWEVPRDEPSLHRLVDATSPRPFIGLPPCRLLDTRGAPIGGGIFPDSGLRNYTFPGSCGIPTGASGAMALSLNITVTGAPAAPPGAFLLAWPQGGAPPPVSILNYQAGQTIANAAIVPTGTGNGITINVSHSTHVIVDVNGYFADVLGTPSNVFSLTNNSGSQTILGQNLATVCNLHCGITGYISSTTGGYAVTGYAIGATGANVGVYGSSSSSSGDSAGVKGVDGSGATGATGYASVGVRGESNDWTGVLGLSKTTSGVTGQLLNSGGGVVAAGVLGANGGPYGVYSLGAFGGSGAKYFVEPHPEKADMVIRYVALEGPESGTYFRGKGRFRNGLAAIEVPEDFRLVTDAEGLSIQVTPIGEMATVAVVRIGLDRILVKGSRNVEFFYTVNGVRKTHKDLQPIGPGREYMPERPDSKMPLYLTEGQKASLISNGTYKEDGTVNLETARRLGWDKIWAKKARSSEPKPLDPLTKE